MCKHLFFVLVLAIAVLGTGCKNESGNEPALPKKYQYDCYDEPCLNWNTGQSSVKQWMTSHGFIYQKTVTISNMYVQYYEPNKSASVIALIFDARGYYQCAQIYIEFYQVTSEELASFLLERYDYISTSNGINYLTTKDKKTSVDLQTISNNGVIYSLVTYEARN